MLVHARQQTKFESGFQMELTESKNSTCNPPEGGEEFPIPE